jgi:hypothetical protein
MRGRTCTSVGVTHRERLSCLMVQMVELGFAAVASLAQTWDSAEPDEDKDGGKAIASWKMGCATVAITFSELLQRACRSACSFYKGKTFQ